MIKAVVFDLWETLFRTFGDPKVFHRKASELMGVPFDLRIYEEVRSTRVGLSAEGAAKEIIERHGVKTSPELVDAFLQAWFEFVDAKRELYPDALETLRTVREKGFKIGLLSNCGEGTLKFLDNSGLKALVDAPHLSCLTGNLKPDKAAFEAVLKDLKVKPSEAIMVGDNVEHDIRPAKALGLKTVLVNHDGNRPGAELADASIKSLKELIVVLDKLK